MSPARVSKLTSSHQHDPRLAHGLFARPAIDHFTHKITVIINMT
jgi:hypothetical protein